MRYTENLRKVHWEGTQAKYGAKAAKQEFLALRAARKAMTMPPFIKAKTPIVRLVPSSAKIKHLTVLDFEDTSKYQLVAAKEIWASVSYIPIDHTGTTGDVDQALWIRPDNTVGNSVDDLRGAALVLLVGSAVAPIAHGNNLAHTCPLNWALEPDNLSILTVPPGLWLAIVKLRVRGWVCESYFRIDSRGGRDAPRVKQVGFWRSRWLKIRFWFKNI